MEDRTKQVTLTFIRDQLLYDITNIAFVVGDTMKKDSEHDSHQIQDIGEDGNVDRVTRMLDLGIAHCREVLFPYSKTPVRNGIVKDDNLKETNAYMIDMMVPDDFSATTTEYLERLIHELLVAWVLADWFSITLPDRAAQWQEMVALLEKDIKSCLARLCGKVYRRRSPFDSGVIR